ncbi:ubiquinone biosynthesis accessory factor UbiJ [Granulosicoccus sp. 3-233]|uniref:ubiquinone biosynthesis accessory factor UbiJ n=1 Tax=Granulosicoccus sp. 3-233 TaxID=3417969 RepID=UPI003D338F9A
MSLPTPLNVAIEQAIEALLVLDPETRARLSAIEGKLICIRVSAPALSLALSVVDGKVHVVGDADDAADTTISGSARALRSLTAGNEALYRGEVSIEGDLHTGQQLKDILAGLDPDWEEFMAPVLGDAVTHRLGTLGRQFGGWLTRTRSSLQQNSRDYLQEESQLLAVDTQVRDFCSQVDEVRAAVDRLAARVQRLERQGNATGTISISNESDEGSTGSPAAPESGA